MGMLTPAQSEDLVRLGNANDSLRSENAELRAELADTGEVLKTATTSELIKELERRGWTYRNSPSLHKPSPRTGK